MDGLIAKLDADRWVAVEVPLSPMFNCSRFQPKMMVFSYAMKVIKDLCLVCSTNVVQIVKY